MFKEIMKSGLLEMEKNYGTKVENVLTGLKIGMQQKFYEIMVLKLGIKEENLITTNEDTFDEKFHSYRREGKSSERATATITFN